jgi:hypothetical protein
MSTESVHVYGFPGGVNPVVLFLEVLSKVSPIDVESKISVDVSIVSDLID